MTEEDLEKEVPEYKPLGLPKGSIRAIIILSLVGIVGFLAVSGNVAPEWFITLATMAISFYFGARVASS